MKKIKILYYFLIAITIMACSTEDDSNSSNTDLTNFEIENYKGIFTTANGVDRGTLNVTVSPDNRSATADLTLTSGEVISIFTDQIFDTGNTKEFTFVSDELSFTITAGEEGETLEANSVLFRGVESSILAARNTERAPVTPVTGTYVCTTCAGPVDNSLTQTFNFMFLGDPSGDSSVTTQTSLGSTVYSGKGIQNSCIANGTLTTCDMTSGDDATNVGYIAGQSPVTWTGSHTFNNEATGPNDCTEITGTWNWDSILVGNVGGTFQSDGVCTAPLMTLYSENFQTFTGAGFAPTPAAGQLDSDIIIANGFNSGSLNYGGTQTSGDYARGLNVGGGVNTGGIYAFDVDGAGNTTLGVQPGGSDFTPGTFDFRIENTTGIALNNLVISYDIYANNDQNRINSLNFSYSTDNITYTPVTSLNYSTPGPSDAMGFVAVNRSANFSATVANGAFIYIRFEGNEAGGNGNSDEYSIDNILLQGN